MGASTVVSPAELTNEGLMQKPSIEQPVSNDDQDTMV
jgi:hypothetical protein